MIVSNIISLILGIGSSFLVWWYLFRKVVPKIEFSESVSRITRNNKPHYRVKFMNKGKRNAIDLSITIKLRIKGLFPDLPNNWKVVYIKTNKQNIPILKAGMRGGVIANFYLNETDEFSKFPFNEEIQKKYQDDELMLEDILKLGKYELTILLMGYDEFSGSRKLFMSKNYMLNDIEKREFDYSSLELKPEVLNLKDINKNQAEIEKVKADNKA